MRSDVKSELPPELQKLTFEGNPADEDDDYWAIEIPEDADVSIAMAVQTTGSATYRQEWGGGNVPGRYELHRITDALSSDSDGDCDEDPFGASACIANARALLDDFEEVSIEVKHGALKHAIEELRNAKRALPDDY